MQQGLILNVSTRIHASAARVWEGITNPDLVREYFFGTNLESNWVVGEPIVYRGEWEGTAYEDKGVILQLEPEKVLKHNYLSSWSGKPDVPENYQVITYTLTPDGDDIILSVSQDNIETEEAKAHSEQNWNLLLGNLKKLLEAA